MEACTQSDFCNSSHIDDTKMSADNIPDEDPDLIVFDNAYETVRGTLCYTEDKALDDLMDWCAKILDYNVQGGKKLRGVILLKAVKTLSGEEMTSDKISQACLLGWCVEMLQGFYLVADDIMDHSTTRRGKICWYKRPEVGLCAINDSLLLEHGIFKILKMHFKECEAYDNILHAFLENSSKTIYGQCLDMLTSSPDAKQRFEKFNLERYRVIVEHKTAFYTFILPVHLAMHLVGNFSEKEFNETKNICLKIGHLFQIQDDYLDVFGDPNVTGKVGTDIIEGKCTWFSAYVFEHAPKSMKKIMMENYGVDKTDAVAKIMNVYRELNLEEKYLVCEKSLLKAITVLIKNLQRDALRVFFEHLLKKLHKRKK